MVLTHAENKRYEDDEGDPYWITFKDSLTVEKDKGEIHLYMEHRSSYVVRTSISLSKKEAESLRDELDRLIQKI